jgi:ADP-dependent NAD(P)H-hydrate dehydratase / NAD(P)H-hydrate epimerase
MKTVLKVEQMQQLDSEAVSRLEIPDILLMENAGRSTATAIINLLEEGGLAPLVILAGKGNNGGDAFVVARQLYHQGVPFDLLATAEPADYSGSAAVNLKILLNLGIEMTVLSDDDAVPDLREWDIIVDGLLGTGIKGAARGLLGHLITAINESGATVIAIDIPSGVNGDSGLCEGAAVFADMTVTMCAPKRGLLLPPGRDHCGVVETAYIGYEPDDLDAEDFWLQTEQDDIIDMLPLRAPSAHKGTVGKVIAVAGSRGLTGAAILASRSTMVSGCGMTTLFCPDSLNQIFETSLAEVMTCPVAETDRQSLALSALDDILSFQDWGDLLMVGPGMGRHQESVELVQKLLTTARLPMVIDADGLWAIAQQPELLMECEVPVCLTPHHGEFLRLIGSEPGEVPYDKLIEAGIEFAVAMGVTLVLKGSPTAIISPLGEVILNSSGNAGMATAGSGDVLTGIISGLAVQGLDLPDAAVAGVWIHGHAGDLAARALTALSVTAPDLIEFLPMAFNDLLNPGEADEPHSH